MKYILSLCFLLFASVIYGQASVAYINGIPYNLMDSLVHHDTVIVDPNKGDTHGWIIRGNELDSIKYGSKNGQRINLYIIGDSVADRVITWAKKIISSAATLTITHNVQYLVQFINKDSIWYLNTTNESAVSGGSGVTSFSATGNNGISTSVSNPTTTPSLTVGITNASIGDSSLANSSLTYNGVTVALGSSGTLTLASSNFANQGTTTTLLHGNGAGNPSWGSVSLTNDITGALAETHGGTNQTTWTKGDIPYASAANTISKLAIGSLNQVLEVNSSGIPAWTTTTGSTSTSILDLTSTYTVKDTTTGNILITATTKPATAQFQYIVKAADEVSNSSVAGYECWLTIGGKNNDVSPRTLNWIACRGSTEFASSNNISVTNADFWECMVMFAVKDVNVGDTLEIKMWASVASQVDYRYCSMYFFPRRISPADGQFMSFYLNPARFDNCVSGTWSGAVAGVTYAGINNPSPDIIDSGFFTLAGTPTAGLSTTVPSPLFIGNGEYLTMDNQGTLSDNNNITSSGAWTSAELIGFAGAGTTGGIHGRIKYIRKWSISSH